MTEYSLPWANGTVGDHGPYADSVWAALWSRIFGNAGADSGIFKGALDEYLATIPGGVSPVVVQPGVGMVDGTYHTSDANVNVVVPTPIGDTRWDRIVLQKTIASEEVRLALHQGVEGAGVPPALTQGAAVWEIPLWVVAIAITGGINFAAASDERIYLQYATEETIPVQAGGRLTLTSGVPVTTSDVVGSTLYYTPWKSDKVPVFVSGSLRNITFSEVSLALGFLGLSLNYDIFGYLDSDGQFKLESLQWSNHGAGTSARAVALALHQGVMVKSTDISRTYLGTIRMVVASGKCQDSESLRCVWNYYNRVPRTLKAVDPVANWEHYGSWGDQNLNETYGEARVGFVIGIQQGELVTATNIGQVQAVFSSATTFASVGIGLNSGIADASAVRDFVYRVAAATGNSEIVPLTARYRGYPPIGFNFLQKIEAANAASAGTVNFFGDDSDTNAAFPKPGLSGVVMA